MSNTWGLARKATAIAVRVLNANGSGTTAYVMQIKTTVFYYNIVNGRIFGFVTGELSVESPTLLHKVEERNLWQSRLLSNRFHPSVIASIKIILWIF